MFSKSEKWAGLGIRVLRIGVLGIFRRKNSNVCAVRFEVLSVAYNPNPKLLYTEDPQYHDRNILVTRIEN